MYKVPCSRACFDEIGCHNLNVYYPVIFGKKVRKDLDLNVSLKSKNYA